MSEVTVQAGRASRWTGQLSDAARKEIKGLCTVQERHPRVVSLLLVIACCAAGAVIVDWLPLRLILWGTIGAAYHGLGSLMHDAVHGTLCRGRFGNRWAGFALGVPLLLGFTAYRRIHLLHHVHLRGKRDPEEFANISRNPRVLGWLFYAWMLLGCPIYIAHVAVDGIRLSQGRERLTVVLEYATICLGVAGVFLATDAQQCKELIWNAWVMPFCFVWLIYNVRSLSEHMLTCPESPLTASRTVISNRVVRWLLCNANYHLEHHLVPMAPWYSLPRLHELLSREIPFLRMRPVRGYCELLVLSLRRGFHGRVPD